MVANLALGLTMWLYSVSDVSGYKLSTLDNPLLFCSFSLFFAHAADGEKKPWFGTEFYFVIFNFCDALLIDAGAKLRFGRNVNRWVV